jgi:hypothetical protein
MYESAERWPTTRTPRSRPANETQWLHFVRVVAGLTRWFAMPMLVLHGLFNHDTRGSSVWASWNRIGVPSSWFISNAVSLARYSPFESTFSLFPRYITFFPNVTLRGAFAIIGGAFIIFRVMQLFFWLFAAPPASKDGKLRILICGDSIPPKIDGVAVRVGHLVLGLKASGHTAHIITSIRRDPLDGAAVTQLDGFEAPCYPGHSITYPNVFQIFAAIVRFRPHVIHILDESFMQAATVIAANLCLIPTVWSHHSRLDKFAEAC